MSECVGQLLVGRPSEFRAPRGGAGDHSGNHAGVWMIHDGPKQTLDRRIIFLALALFGAGAPLLPGNDLKVAATLSSVLVLAVGWYVRLRRTGRIARTPLDVPAITFFTTATLATLFSVNPFVSFFPSALRGDGLLVYAAYIAMTLTAARLGPNDAHALVTLTVASGSLIGAVGVAQYYGLDITRWVGNGGLPPMARSLGTLGNPIFLGGYVTLVLPVGIVLAADEGERRWWPYAVAAIMMYGALLGSETRAAWIGTAAAGILLMRVLRPSSRGAGRLAFLISAFAGMTVVMMLTRPDISYAQRALSSFAVTDSSLESHLFVWKNTLPLLLQRPLLGWGFSTLLGRLPGIGSPEYLQLFGYRLLVLDTPHNEILNIAYGAGLVGLGAYLWVWATVVVSLWRALGTPAAGPRLPAALLAALLGYFMWLQLAWSHIGPANVFWVFAGTAIAPTPAAHRQHFEERVHARPPECHTSRDPGRVCAEERVGNRVPPVERLGCYGRRWRSTSSTRRRFSRTR